MNFTTTGIIKWADRIGEPWTASIGYINDDLFICEISKRGIRKPKYHLITYLPFNKLFSKAASNQPKKIGVYDTIEQARKVMDNQLHEFLKLFSNEK